MGDQRNRFDVEATALDEAGAGVGVAGGVELHVTDLLPGERAEVEVEHSSPHRAVAWARVRTRGAASPARVAPVCPGWGACGGCAWQHLGYEAQLVEKRRRVETAVGRPVAPVVPSPRTLGYRNKGKYVAAAGPHGLVLGAYAPRTHRVVDTAGCRVVAPVIDEVAAAARGACDALVPYDEQRRLGELRYVIVRADEEGGALVVLGVTSAARAPVVAAAAATLAAHPAVRGVVQMRNDRTDGGLLTDDVRVLAGTGTLVEEVADCPVEVGAGEFLQVNRDQARAMYARVAALALDGLHAPLAVDLYAGVGGIALTMARAGARVVAVEIDPAACAALERAAGAGKLDVRVQCGDASVIGALGLAPEVIVVDPPRKGLSAETRAALLQLAPRRIVYVSCGPDALGRDLAALEVAYEVRELEPYDLMPGTAQVETIVRLEARS